MPPLEGIPLPPLPKATRQHLKLHAVGSCKFRPLASSHFFYIDKKIGDNNAYAPAQMTELALINGIEKYYEPFKGVDEKVVVHMLNFMISRLAPFWWGNNVMSLAEAIKRLDMLKSAGYPWYFDADCKGTALAIFGKEICDLVFRFLQGEEIPLFFAMTLKDELRTIERVLASKTRVFNASDIVHLLCSKILFEIQNEKLRAHLGKHPLTIGLGVPGPQFVSTVLKLGSRAHSADVSGCDARFPLWHARVIAHTRAAFLPSNMRTPAINLYRNTYCGCSVVLGVIYRMFGNKSGHENTGDDNGMSVWISLEDARLHFAPYMTYEEFIVAIINGDDIGLSILVEEITIQMVADWLKENRNVHLEIGNEFPLPPSQIVFLSHSLKLRSTNEYGDFWVAAGNLPKLLSSVSWPKKNSDFLDYECVLMHWLGLRIALWPWAIYFDAMEELIDEFLATIDLTPRVVNILKARIGFLNIAQIHLRLEGLCFLFYPKDPNVVIKWETPFDLKVASYIKGVLFEDTSI